MSFYEEVLQAYNDTLAHGFTLHGNINDHVEGTEIDLLPWLKSKLTALRFDLVITYTISAGIEFANPKMRELFEKAQQSAQPQAQPQVKGGPLAALNAGGGGNLPPDLSTLNPLDAFAAMGKALRMVERLTETGYGYKVALIFPYAHHLFGSSGVAGVTPMQERALREFAQEWARNQVWRSLGGEKWPPMIFLVTENLAQLDAGIAEAYYPVELAPPSFEEREGFITQVLKRTGVKLDSGLTVRRVASLTAGLKRVHLVDVVSQARARNGILTADMVKRRKDSIIQAQSAGLLETVEPGGNLDDVIGMQEVKQYFRQEVIPAMQEGDYTRVPKGVMAIGPAGVGKTYMAEKLAGETGFNCVYLRTGNLKGSLMGESQAKLEKALAFIRTMTPCIVIVDEAEGQPGFRSRELAGAGANSVDTDFISRILNFMSQEERGKVMFFVITNYPSQIDAAIQRPGRIDAKLIFVPPVTDEQREAMLKGMARKNGVEFAKGMNLTAAASKLEGYTGAEIERIVLKAAAVAGGRKVDQKALDRAIWAIRTTGQAAKNRMLQEAIAYIDDRDLVPQELQYWFDQEEAAEAGVVQETGGAAPELGRRSRSLG